MAHPKNKNMNQELIDKDPFLHLKINDASLLESVEHRSPCPACHKSRKYFCYTCCVPIAGLENKLPEVELPIKIDIIKHKHEIDGKSTAVHAAILARCDVTIYTYPEIPNYEQSKKTVLIFPSTEAQSIMELFHSYLYDTKISRINIEPEVKGCHRGTLLRNKINNDLTSVEYTDDLPIDRAVFIDSTWNQSKGIYKDIRIKQLPCVVLQNRISQFWRHQKNSPRWYLSTIEAIHQLVLEMHINAWGCHQDYHQALQYLFSDVEIMNELKVISDESNRKVKSYNGQYDNLLYFFKYMHKKIHDYYDHSQLQAYQRPLT